MGNRRGATKHRAILRRRGRERRLGVVIAGVVGVIADVRAVDSPFGRFVDGFLMDGLPHVRHCGDLLPIPRLSAAMCVLISQMRMLSRTMWLIL